MLAIQSLSAGVLRGCRDTLAAIPRSLWHLSNRALLDLYPRVEIWCDPPAETWLRRIGCHYHAWHRLPAIPPDLTHIWNLGKLHAAQAAATHGPFLHIDGDLLLRTLPPTADFLCEREEPRFDGSTDRTTWWDVGFAPPHLSRPATPTSYNFGVFGAGTAQGAAHLHIAISTALHTIYHTHRSQASSTHFPYLPHCIEQMWIPELMRHQGTPITPLLSRDTPHQDAIALRYYHAMGDKALWLQQESLHPTASPNEILHHIRSLP